LEAAWQVRELEGHTIEILDVALSGDGRLALSSSHDGTLRRWDVKLAQCTRTFGERTLLSNTDISFGPFINAVSLSADGRWALSGGEYLNLIEPSRAKSHAIMTVWDVVEGSCTVKLVGHAKGVNCVALSENANLALSGSSDGSLKLW